MDIGQLVWIGSLLVVLAIVVPYFIQFRRKKREFAERKKEAAALGIDRPVAQYPFIDASKCIGCAACVDACPEGDVLGIVGGKATVINGLRCVGHGRCEQVCPVGAIEVGLGDIKQRDDIPVMNEFNETTVPGMFIAGELSGLALIRIAVEQGRKVIEHIAITRPRSTDPSVQDVIIVGAGPAGLSAALTAIQHRLSYLVIEREKDIGGTILHYPRKKLVMTQPLELPLYGKLKKETYLKEELMEIWQEIARRFNLQARLGEEVTDIRRENGVFVVQTPKGLYRARHVVLAIGRRGTPRKLGVPGEDLPKVMYKLMDATTYQNDRILIVGGGDSAVEAAIGLARQKGNDITISYRKGRFFRIKKKNQERIEKLMKAGRVKVIFNSNVKEIREKSVVLRVGEDREIEIPNDYVFIFIGGVPPFNFLRKIGVRFTGDLKKTA